MLLIKLAFRTPLTVLNPRISTVLTHSIESQTQKNMTLVLLLKNVIKSNRMMCLNFTWLLITRFRNSQKYISNNTKMNTSSFKSTKMLFFKNYSAIRTFGLLKQKIKPIYNPQMQTITNSRNNTSCILSPTILSSNRLRLVSISMVRISVFNTSSLNSSNWELWIWCILITSNMLRSIII
jgi:hypothetical protein